MLCGGALCSRQKPVNKIKAISAYKSEVMMLPLHLSKQRNRMYTPLDYSKPLWQFQFIENYRGGCAVVARIHHCIGAPRARQELTLGFPALLERMENIRLAPGHPEPEAEPSMILRNLPHLHIRFERR